ncbi:MAG: cupin domain-containing protein [Pigmentiphaga sp.]|nr:cupin domain-containing protein [Pigmentiphaga sp.]
MHPRARQLIDQLKLQPHPEGGLFAEVYRSAIPVSRADGSQRAALTTIYFLLPEGAVSQWHRVAADEVWHFYEGAPLRLSIAEAPGHMVRHEWLGVADECCRPVRIVPAHAWQGAASSGAFTLVGCTVAPGFDFADFVLLDQLDTTARPTLPPLAPNPAF